MSGSSPYQVPRAPGRWRAIALALIVHGALLAFLWIGISWQNKTPQAVEAEIWDPQIKEAAPLPVPVPTPPPAPQPAPEPAPPPPKVEEKPMVKPDIALEKEKKRKQQELQAKLAQEEQARLQREKQEKADRLKMEKQEADKKLAKQKEDAEAKKKADADKLAKERQQKQLAAENKAAEQRHQDDLKLMMSQATSAIGGNGTAAKSQGPRGNADYGAKIAMLIRSNTRFDIPPGLVGNPAVEYAVELFPDGTIRSIRLLKQSGIPGFDEAVKQGITKSQPFPADTDGKVPSGFPVRYQPKETDK